MIGRCMALGITCAVFVTLTLGQHRLLGADDEKSSKTIHFLRPTETGFVNETKIHVVRTEQGSVITSTTQRGEQVLTVTARFDRERNLTSASVLQRDRERETSASVKVRKGTARVQRNGNEPIELSCPAGVIVTSAPDWTDSFMAVRRYDPKGSTAQSFPGLWIHPTREPLELAIKLTRLGHDSVMHDEKTVTLDRYLLLLRGGSRYIVWGNQQQLVRLVPEPRGKGGIVLAGWERATRDLKHNATHE